MNYLSDYYNARATTVDANDFLKQVSHTERGMSITEQQFEAMIARICDLLDLGPQDDLLDLCCGNGVITCRLAQKVRSAEGVDFSTALIDLARKNHQRDNLRYQVGNALDLGEIRNPTGGKFTKVVMHAALQHFRQEDFERLLKGIMSVCVAEPVIVFGYVLERGKEALFYDTFKRKFVSIVRRLTRRDIVGTWWDKAFISRTCGNLGVRCTFHEIEEGSDASLYRFDVKIG